MGRPGARFGRTATALALLALLAAAVAWTAQRSHSATFDEIVLVAGGVRGLGEGRWEMVTDQPPLMMYAYGAAAAGAVGGRPPEDRPWLFEDRWTYARSLLFHTGNDAQRVLGRARAVSALLAALLVAATGAYAWWVAGPAAGLVAGAATAFLPDVLAHGGVAYNDLPLAFAFLLAVWALDRAVRVPGPGRAALAALAVAATFGVKMSALALAPVALALLGLEAWRRWGERAWWRDVGVSLAVGGAALWIGLVVLYRGDPALTLLRFNFWRTVLHASGGHEAPAFLLGEVRAGGWWYYYPVAFLFKTPVPFQLLVLLGAMGLWRAARPGPPGGSTPAAGALRWRPALERGAGWRGRGALLGGLVFGAFLVRSDLNAGFRYALPVLPCVVVCAAVGVSRLWSSGGRRLRAALVVLLALQAASVLSFHPHYLAYSSLWAGGRDRAHQVLADSNIDWGQELLSLRDFMSEEGVTSVRLSYFGSAPPDAYGIEYVGLPSFFRLDPGRTSGAEAEPRFTVISATNLRGLYLQGFDPFAAYRGRDPYRVLGHSLFVFDDGRG